MTLEEYHTYSANQRKKVLRCDLQKLLDEHLDTEGSIASIRGIIRDELNTKFETLKTDLTRTLDAKIRSLTTENSKLAQENLVIKKVLGEQQKCLERMQRNSSKENIFISGIPNKLLSDMSDVPGDDANPNDVTDDHTTIIHHVLNFVNPDITNNCYKIVKNFDAREGYTRHSAKISVVSSDVRSKIFKGCSKFRDIHRDNYMKRIFLKNDDPPMTRKENDRLYKKMKELREAEDKDNPENKYFIKGGKLYKNDEADSIDEFNLSNQLFQ